MARNINKKKTDSFVGIDAAGILTRDLNTRLREAVTNGTNKIELRNVYGQRYIGTDLGKPVEIEDDRHVPEDLRMAYKILKNANCVPPELELKKEIRRMEDMLENLSDEKEKYLQIKKINFKIMQLNMLKKTSPLLEDTEIYYKKVVEKAGKEKT